MRPTFAAQIFLDQGVVAFGGGLHQGHVRLFGRSLQVGRDIAQLLALAQAGLHGQQAHHALEAGLFADGQLHGHQLGLEGLLDLRQGARVVGVFAVQLVDDHEARQLILVGVAPDQLGAHLHAGHGIHHHDGGLADVQGGFDLADEVGEAGRVQDVDFVVVILDGDDGGGDGDLAPALLVLKIGDGRAVLDLALPRDGAGVEQERFGQGRLARTAVPDERDIADLVGSVLFH